jgi:heterodisulfide reductase subunit C
MAAKHKVTLAELRELASKAFPDVSRGGNYDVKLASDCWRCEAVTSTCDVRGYGHSRMAARRQLRDLLERLIAGSGTDEYDRGYRDGKDGG